MDELQKGRLRRVSQYVPSEWIPNGLRGIGFVTDLCSPLIIHVIYMYRYVIMAAYYLFKQNVL